MDWLGAILIYIVMGIAIVLLGMVVAIFAIPIIAVIVALFTA